MLKTEVRAGRARDTAYHLGEGRVLKTFIRIDVLDNSAYHLGEGRVLKTRPADGRAAH